MSTQTPGPWVVYDTGTRSKDKPIYHVGIESGRVPQHEPVASWVWKKEDARLIAAAPEMLRLLHRLGGANPGPAQTLLRGYPALEEELLALIAKAEGRP